MSDEEEFEYPPPPKEVTDQRIAEKLRTLPRVTILKRGGKNGIPSHVYYAWDGRSLGLGMKQLGKDPAEAMRKYTKYESTKPSGRVLEMRKTWTPNEELRALPEWARAMYHNARTRGKKRGAMMTVERFVDLVRRANGRCELSGLPLSTVADGGPWSPSIDRIDCRRGYEYENCRIVCVMANLAMNKWGAEPLYRLAEGLLQNSLAKDAEKPRKKPLKSTA